MKRASRLEILGSWLGLWTAPRDVYVPPVPWGKVAAGAGVLALAGVFFGLVIAPVIDEAKDEGTAAQERATEQVRAARRERLEREQRARTGRLTSLSGVEAAIGADAEERFDTDGRPADCDPAPGVDVSAPSVLYDCHVTVRELVSGGDQEGARGALTIPYRARLYVDEERYAFCKVNPRPGEQALEGPESVIELPRPCRAT